VHEAVHGLQHYPFHGRADLVRQLARDAGHLFPGDVFGAAAHPAQRGSYGPACEPAQVAPQFGFDDLLGGGQVIGEIAGLAQPAGSKVGQVDQPYPGQRPYGGIDVARHR
jgi:hypothetical protein